MIILSVCNSVLRWRRRIRIKKRERKGSGKRRNAWKSGMTGKEMERVKKRQENEQKER